MLGSWGKSVVFDVNDNKVFSPRNMNYNKSGRWHSHSIVSDKPITEFLGPELDQFTMQIVLDVMLGVNPSAVISVFEDAVENGTVNPLMIGPRRIGKNRFAISSISEAYNVVYNGGQLARATIDVTFSEYR